MNLRKHTIKHTKYITTLGKGFSDMIMTHQKLVYKIAKSKNLIKPFRGNLNLKTKITVTILGKFNSTVNDITYYVCKITSDNYRDKIFVTTYNELTRINNAS